MKMKKTLIFALALPILMSSCSSGQNKQKIAWKDDATSITVYYGTESRNYSKKLMDTYYYLVGYYETEDGLLVKRGQGDYRSVDK